MDDEVIGGGDLIEIEVAYAKSEEQVVVTVSVPRGTTIEKVVSLSGLVLRFPEISNSGLKVGVFGVGCKPCQPVKKGDRVEIYRPLIHDPKEARRQRALRSQ